MVIRVLVEKNVEVVWVLTISNYGIHVIDEVIETLILLVSAR